MRRQKHFPRFFKTDLLMYKEIFEKLRVSLIFRSQFLDQILGQIITFAKLDNFVSETVKNYKTDNIVW